MTKKQLSFILCAGLLLSACDCADDAEISSEMGVGAGTHTAIAEKFAAETEHKVHFGFDQSNLTPTMRTRLESQAKWMKEHQDVSLEVQGYCDKRGPIAYNDRLGQRRADAASQYLHHLGIDSSRVKTVSYGNRVTLVPGDSEESYAENRVAIGVAQ